jgi:hypothetical protein
MKLNSKKCIEVLKKYTPKEISFDKVEMVMQETAIRVLLTHKPEEVINIPGIRDMTDEEIDKLAEKIRQIRKELGIED